MYISLLKFVDFTLNCAWFFNKNLWESKELYTTFTNLYFTTEFSFFHFLTLFFVYPFFLILTSSSDEEMKNPQLRGNGANCKDSSTVSHLDRPTEPLNTTRLRPMRLKTKIAVVISWSFCYSCWMQCKCM